MSEKPRRSRYRIQETPHSGMNSNKAQRVTIKHQLRIIAEHMNENSDLRALIADLQPRVDVSENVIEELIEMLLQDETVPEKEDNINIEGLSRPGLLALLVKNALFEANSRLIDADV